MAGDADGARCRAASLLALLQWDRILPSGKYPFMAVLSIQEAGSSFLWATP